MISHFKVTRLPSADIVSVIGADPLEKDQLYPIARQTELHFSRINALEGYYVEDSFEYQVYEEDADRYSNVATANLIWKENDLATPLLSSTVITSMVIGEKTNLLDLLPINKAVEFIEITSTTGVNDLSFNGTPIVSGAKLSPSDLLKSEFRVQDGGGTPYFEFEYKLGRSLQTEENIYKVTINVDAMAGLGISNLENSLYVAQDENGFDLNFAKSFAMVALSGGPSLSEVKLRLTVNHPWIGQDENNTTEIIAGGMENYITSANEVLEVDVFTAKNGSAFISMETNFIYTEGQSYAGTVDVEILQVNGDTLEISQENKTVTVQTNIPDEL
jgi:hypothetical protein